MKNIEQFMTTESADQHIAEVEAIVNKAYELHVPARETNTFWGLKNDMVTVQRRHIAKLHAHLANKYVLDWLTTCLNGTIKYLMPASSTHYGQACMNIHMPCNLISPSCDSYF